MSTFLLIIVFWFLFFFFLFLFFFFKEILIQLCLESSNRQWVGWFFKYLVGQLSKILFYPYFIFYTIFYTCFINTYMNFYIIFENIEGIVGKWIKIFLNQNTELLSNKPNVSSIYFYFLSGSFHHSLSKTIFLWVGICYFYVKRWQFLVVQSKSRFQDNCKPWMCWKKD